ncbi:MAG: LysR family transcriptional regulator [Verrucomicrobiae bacterium]|nr:LysR family transcriptional regulator [Verrucomicrobiae bacterium]
MEFHQLRYFVAAAEELSMTAAAHRLHVSQPALSRQIGALEEELGTALFDRIRKRIHLTEAGRFFLPKARQILCDAETAAQQVGERFAEVRRTLRLGFLSVFLDDLITPALKSMRRESPNLELALFELSPRAQLDRLRDGELDLAVVGNVDEEDRERFSVQRLMNSPMAAVLPGDHPLAERKRIALDELAGEPFVSLSDAVFPGRRQFLRDICRRQGFEPDIAVENDSLTLLLNSVSTGLGVALLPFHSRKLPHAGCVFVPLKSPKVSAEIMAVTRRGPVGKDTARLVEHLAEASQEISST